jgi:hypothetical protein
LLTQKCLQKKPVTDFRYPRACRFRKTKQTNQFWVNKSLSMMTMMHPI